MATFPESKAVGTNRRPVVTVPIRPVAFTIADDPNLVVLSDVCVLREGAVVVAHLGIALDALVGLHPGREGEVGTHFHLLANAGERPRLVAVVLEGEQVVRVELLGNSSSIGFHFSIIKHEAPALVIRRTRRIGRVEDEVLRVLLDGGDTFTWHIDLCLRADAKHEQRKKRKDFLHNTSF